MAMPHVHLTEIAFSGGDTVSLGPKDKVLIVGPNNAGKSQALREIFALLEKGPERTRSAVVRAVTCEKMGSEEEVLWYLKENFEGDPGLPNQISAYGKSAIHMPHMGQYWSKAHQTLNKLIHVFANAVDTEGRLGLAASVQHKERDHSKTRPHHFLYEDKDLLKQVSAVFREAFNVDLMIDYLGGGYITFHIGEPPDAGLGPDPTEKPYAGYIRSLPGLDKQGDGMRSYAGILFETMVNPRDMTLLDEPKAFLHPPQMRRLGRTLAEKAKGQLIVATHSSDILRGFVEGTAGENLRILRITRDGDQNRVHEADPSSLRALWEKPEFRYSKVRTHSSCTTGLTDFPPDCEQVHRNSGSISSDWEDGWRKIRQIQGTSNLLHLSGSDRSKIEPLFPSQSKPLIFRRFGASGAG